MLPGLLSGLPLVGSIKFEIFHQDTSKDLGSLCRVYNTFRGIGRAKFHIVPEDKKKVR